MNSLEQVLMKWRAGGVDLLPPLDDIQIATVVKSLGQGLSSDVAEMYRATGGMQDGEMDDLCFSLWPLDRVVAENQKHPVDGVLFADFLIDSHVYLFRYEGADVSTVHVEYGDGRGPQLVASSVQEFFYLCLSGPEQVGL
jgi:hypothetical protein